MVLWEVAVLQKTAEMVDLIILGEIKLPDSTSFGEFHIEDEGRLIYSLEPSFVLLTGCSVDIFMQAKHPVSLVIPAQFKSAKTPVCWSNLCNLFSV